MALQPGARLGHHEILGALGAGGMGEVYRARHLKLRRDDAIKVLPADVAGDPARRSRFEREARAASALNHPNIVTIHDIAEHDGTTYIAMELVEGQTLRDMIAERPLPVDRALHIAVQLADGLAKAHAAGIVHRDIKPANVMVTADGLVKILDFGLAKPLLGSAGRASTPLTVTTDTHEGMIVGTPHYMSPEQLAGDQVDHRADQFAFGVVLYEMLGGKPPFDGPSLAALISAIMTHPAPPLRVARPDAPHDVERVITRCLAKDPAGRFPTMKEAGIALQRCVDRRARAAHGLRAWLRQPAVAGSIVTAAILFGAAGIAWARGAERRWARSEALVEIAMLADSGVVFDAWRMSRRAAAHRPDDPELAKVVNRITLPVAVNSEPAGAAVWVKGYATPEAEWEYVGTTPLELRIPYALMRWRIEKEGYEPFEGAPFSGPALMTLGRGITLEPVGSRPAGMIRVPAGPLNSLPGVRPRGELPAVQLDAYYLDRHEVTNRQYREFVAAGGYRDRRWWTMELVRDGRAVSWEEAIDGFRDSTGRHGPSTWSAGTYAPGDDDLPVSGISWFEAAAYCAFAGRSLPTVYHWFRALGQDQLSDILRFSNMDGDAKEPVGANAGLSAYGTYDMAGNVKEWAWNAAGDLRYILGGSWNEPTYVFKHLVAQHPWGREATYGVRCASYPAPPSAELMAPVVPMRNYGQPDPITDREFEVLRGMYVYDRDSLDARVEARSDSPRGYIRETVSIRTAYGDERMQIHLLIPRDAEPPYQSVIWFPGDDVFMLRSSESFSSMYLFDFLPAAGRVVVHPVYHGMYERWERPDFEPAARRDRMVRWAQDIGRTIDYLETRPDFDATKIGYYGFSAGAIYGPVFTAVEPRIAASILLGGGLVPMPFRPESHPVHFAPRSRTPTLMINGREDFLMPYDRASGALFELLGAPPDRKRHARPEGGHIPSRLDIMREVLDWLDEQLGPVQRRSTTTVAHSTAAGASGGRPR